MNIYTKFYDFMAEIIRLLEDHTNEDFMQKEYRRMILDVLKATLIIVPSFSTGNFDFRQVMGECRQYDCGVIWLNCCGAMHLEEKK